MSSLKESAFALLNTWTTCDTSLVAQDLDAEFVEYDRPQPEVKGLAGLNEKLAAFHKVHSNVSVKVLKQFAAGDIVCTQWLLTCTLKIPESSGDLVSRTLVQPGISWTYFDNGKIVKNRVYRDMVGYLMQRGYRWSEAKPFKATEKELQS